MIALNRPVIQAFPINDSTVVATGGVTDFAVEKDLIVHLLADADVTVDFGGTPKQFSLSAGMDFTVPRSAVSLSVTADCLIS